MQKKKVYFLCNDDTPTMNWANVESQVEELATTNDTNIWMSNFFDANVYSPPQKITNFIGVEPYNINIDSNNVDA